MNKRIPWNDLIGKSFTVFEPAIDWFVYTVSQANDKLPQGCKLDFKIIDSCFPEQYQNQNSQVLLTNNWIAPDALDTSRYESLNPWFFGVYHGNHAQDDIEPTKAFNCLIRRMDPNRQSWLYQLVRRRILDQGHVSFNMDISRHIMNGDAEPTESPHKVFQRQFENHCGIFAPEHEFIKHLVPYRSFSNDWTMEQVIMNSKFSLVLETYFIDPRMITVSEKTVRCLKLPRPWIVFSTRGTVNFLRQQGFDVLDDVVDHSYDIIDNDIDRQVSLLNLTQQMIQQPWTPDLLARCKKAADHNSQLIEYWHKNFYREIKDAVSRAAEKCKQLQNK